MSSANRVIAFEHAHNLNPDASYLGQVRFALWLRNTSSTAIRIRSIALRLQTDDPTLRDDPLLVSRHEGVSLIFDPGARRAVEFNIIPPLIALGWSNSLAVTAEFEQVYERGFGLPRVESREQFGYLIIREPPTHESAEVFVSFVDPENDSLANLAAMYLRRAGMRPYLAKHDTRTGCDQWEGKIYPAIRRSCGVLAVWSADSVRRPESVLREMDYARQAGVRVGLFLERGVRPPRSYPRAIKEYIEFERLAARIAFARAIAAGAERWARTGRFFDE